MPDSEDSQNNMNNLKMSLRSGVSTCAQVSRTAANAMLAIAWSAILGIALDENVSEEMKGAAILPITK